MEKNTGGQLPGCQDGGRRQHGGPVRRACREREARSTGHAYGAQGRLGWWLVVERDDAKARAGLCSGKRADLGGRAMCGVVMPASSARGRSGGRRSRE
jgi:hypothetical protein